MKTYQIFFMLPKFDQESLNDPNRPKNVKPIIDISLESMKFDVDYASGPTIDELMGVLGKIQAKAVPELENKRSDNGFIFKSPCPIRIHSIQPTPQIEPQK